MSVLGIQQKITYEAIGTTIVRGQISLGTLELTQGNLLNTVGRHGRPITRHFCATAHYI